MKNQQLHLKKEDQKEGKSVVLTISILVSKRPDTIRKCLDSIKPILEVVDAELILTDTGCGDEVRKIIEEYTDHIIDFVWCNDFSKARNAGLKQARGEWFLFLDDDEWFEDVSEIIQFFNSGEYKKYGIAVYRQRNYIDDKGSQYKDTAVGRMIRLEKDICFQYKIHECFNRVPGKTKVLDAYVHHYGYVQKTKEEMMAHSKRNIDLLLIEYKNDPGNLKHLIQLIQEYNVLEHYEESLRISLAGIEYAKENKVTHDFCRNSIFVNVINTYYIKEEFSKVIELGNQYLHEETLDELAKAYLYYRMAAACFEMQEYVSSVLYAKEYMERYEKQLRKPEIYIAYSTNITSMTFQLGNPEIVMCMLIWTYIALQEHENASLWFQKYTIDKKSMELWNWAVRSFWNKISLNVISEFHQWMIDNDNIDKLHKLSWNRAYMYEVIKMYASHILKDNLPEESIEELFQELYEYSASSMELYSEVYDMQTKDVSIEELPPEGQTGFILEVWKESMMQGQYANAIGYLKLIMKQMPDLGQVVQVCLKGISMRIKKV